MFKICDKPDPPNEVVHFRYVDLNPSQEEDRHRRKCVSDVY